MDHKQPKIVSIIPYKVLPAKLGGEKGIALFYEYLGRLAEVTGISTKNNDPQYAINYKLLNILSDSKLRYINPLLYFSIRRVLLQQKATHLFIEHPYFGWLAWALKKTLPVVWVVHSHNIEYMRSRSIGRWWWRALKAYERWVYRRADKVFFISDEDREHAIKELGVSVSKSFTVTYGIEQAGIPDDSELHECRRKIGALHGIDQEEKVLLFNGALYHHTNYDALRIILNKINPVLLGAPAFKYKIIICGKGLPAFFNELKEYADKHIIYAGFVEDISLYFKAADVFLNPILSGGGIKTKAIEALAMNCTVVSTELGAMGIKREICGDKLHIIENHDWQLFAETVIHSAQKEEPTPPTFFDYYYWGRVADKTLTLL